MYKMFNRVDHDSDNKPQWLLDQAMIINQTLIGHEIKGKVVQSIKGASFTRHEISLEPGVLVNLIPKIRDNLMMNLTTKTLRIEAPIPGRSFVGIEVPNKVAHNVTFGNLIETKELFKHENNQFKVALGEDVHGSIIYLDIDKMPHALMAGDTGSGKSICVNSILISLLMKNNPEDLKLILMDPKVVELTPYNNLPHLITPVITNTKKAANALNWVLDEMQKRFNKLLISNARNINIFNDKVQRKLIKESKMPFLIVIIEEITEFMSDVEINIDKYIHQITKKAHLVGIHLVVTAHINNLDKIEDLNKNNFPTRITFKVPKKSDSIKALDEPGAEQLIGKGDMLLKEPNRMMRVQGIYLTTDEIDQFIDFITKETKPKYLFRNDFLEKITQSSLEIDDYLFVEVLCFIVFEKECLIKSIQNEYNIGFNRAQKMVSLFEQYDFVSTPDGIKPREVLIDHDDLKVIFEKLDLSPKGLIETNLYMNRDIITTLKHVEVLIQNGEYEQSKKILLKILKMDPKNGEAEYILNGVNKLISMK